jgi:hypothetical protein
MSGVLGACVTWRRSAEAASRSAELFPARASRSCASVEATRAAAAAPRSSNTALSKRSCAASRAASSASRSRACAHGRTPPFRKPRHATTTCGAAPARRDRNRTHPQSRVMRLRHLRTGQRGGELVAQRVGALALDVDGGQRLTVHGGSSVSGAAPLRQLLVPHGWGTGWVCGHDTPSQPRHLPLAREGQEDRGVSLATDTTETANPALSLCGAGRGPTALGALTWSSSVRTLLNATTTLS